MMTSQKQLDVQSGKCIQENESQNQINKEEIDASANNKSISSTKGSTTPTFKPNVTLHLVFNDLNVLQEKIAEKHNAFKDIDGTPSTNLKNLEFLHVIKIML